MLELPGVAAELYEHFCKQPGVDMELAIALTLGFMDWASNGACHIKAPPLGPLSHDLEACLWGPVEQGFVLVAPNADKETAIIALNRALAAVEPSKPDNWEWDAFGENAVYVPGGGPVNSKAWPQTGLPLHLVEWAQTMRNAKERLIVRMCETARTFAQETALRWMKKDPSGVGDLIKRWMNVAALLALGHDRLISADILVVAMHIAITNDRLARNLIAEAHRQLREGGAPC